MQIFTDGTCRARIINQYGIIYDVLTRTNRSLASRCSKVAQCTFLGLQSSEIQWVCGEGGKDREWWGVQGGSGEVGVAREGQGLVR